MLLGGAKVGCLQNMVYFWLSVQPLLHVLLLVPWQVSLMDKIKFLQSCNLGSSFSKMLHHSFYILSITCKPKDFLSISWRYRTVDPQNGCHVGNGIYVLTFMSLNEVGTWVRATTGLPSWIFFVHIHCRNAADFKLFKQLTFEKASFKLRFWCRKNGSSLLGIFSGYFWTSSHGLVIYFTYQPIA